MRSPSGAKIGVPWVTAKAPWPCAVTQGTPIFAPDGDRIGSVRQVVADAHGNVQQVLVRVDGETASLPANYFQASGSGLISVVGEGQIKRIAEQQEAAENGG